MTRISQPSSQSGEDDHEPKPAQVSEPDPQRAKWVISIAIILGSLTTSVMFGSVNIALPTMMTSLRAEVNQIQWILTAFMITRTVMMPTLGWVGGMLGNRRLYLGSLSFYLLASGLCGLAWNIESMIVFRIMQAIGAGYLAPLSLTILHETFPANERGTAMGIFMAGLSLGPAIGPWLGGYFIEQVSWRWIFYINIPIGLVALGTAMVTLPEGKQERQKRTVDLLGLTTMAVFVVSLLLAVSQARDYGWSDPYIVSLLALSGLSLSAFIVTELTDEMPLVDLRIYANVQFILASVVTFFNSLTNFGMNFIMTLFLQRAIGYNAQQAGEILLPSALMWGVTSLFSGRLADKMEPRWLILGGSVMLALVFYTFVTISVWSGMGFIIVLMILRSLARGLIQSPIMTLVMSSLPDDHVRLGAGLRGLLNSLGGTFGVALAGYWLQQRVAVRTRMLQENQHLEGFDVEGLVGSVQEQLLLAGDQVFSLPAKTQVVLNRWLVQEATAFAYYDMFVMTAVLVLLAAIPVIWLRRRGG
ncbi:MAG: hypothetical protein ETSY2_05650 [Candidatus Entotheonella gemina]|uniref:Major facilitator superfamily (MFS) profile domain-containing protein n=1 Tax=Candidatus Entotheonella gemina TaxID=1429439 RepID=W4MDW1_9BACT|nr:MAG: hypothetical protein ETSY2_05650 [Candidatus Entotheonella gemina]